MKKNPLISVIMCTYNARPFIEEAVNSILNQSYKNWELIISDDGSNDGTREWLDTLNTHPQVHLYFQKKNLGYVKNKNFAHQQAQGEYITQMDNDDRCPTNRLQKQIEVTFTHPDNKIVGCGFIRIDTMGKEYLRVDATGDFIIPPGIRTDYPFWFPALLIHKSVFEQVGWFDEYFAGILGDDLYWAGKANQMYPIYCLKEALYEYRDAAGSITNKMTNERKLIMPSVLVKLLEQRIDTGTDWLEQKNMTALSSYEQLLLKDKYLMAEMYKKWAAKAIGKGDFEMSKKFMKKSFGFRPINSQLIRTAIYYIREKYFNI